MATQWTTGEGFSPAEGEPDPWLEDYASIPEAMKARGFATPQFDVSLLGALPRITVHQPIDENNRWCAAVLIDMPDWCEVVLVETPTDLLSLQVVLAPLARHVEYEQLHSHQQELQDLIYSVVQQLEGVHKHLGALEEVAISVHAMAGLGPYSPQP